MEIEMAKYKIILHGKNFLFINYEKKTEKMGFYVVRFVEAENKLIAEKDAIEKAYLEISKKRRYKNSESDPPLIEISEISEIESFKGMSSSGFIFYPEDTPK